MTGPELVGILIAIVVIWFVLKLMKVAFKMILFIIFVLIIAAVVYQLFSR